MLDSFVSVRNVNCYKYNCEVLWSFLFVFYGGVSRQVKCRLLIRVITLSPSVTGVCTGFHSSQAQQHLVSLIRFHLCIMKWMH